MTIIQMGARAPERRRAVSAYVRRSASLSNESTKQPQRDRVLDHFLKNLPPHLNRLRIGSHPGHFWSFEHQLDESLSIPLEVRGFEWDWGVAERSKNFMPGNRPKYHDWPIRVGSWKGYQSENNYLIWGNTSSFLSTFRTEIGGTGSRKRKWVQRWKLWSAFWFDFTSPLCHETVRSLQRVEFMCDRDIDRIPMAITLSMRDDKIPLRAFSDSSCPVERRSQVIRALFSRRRFRDIKIEDAWTYLSTGGAPMFMMLGFLCNRETV